MDNNFETPDPITYGPEDFTTDPFSSEGNTLDPLTTDGYSMDPLPADGYPMDTIPVDDHAADFEPQITYEQDFTPDEIAAFDNFGSEATAEAASLTGPSDSPPEDDLDGYDTLAQGMLGLAQEPEPGDLDYWPASPSIEGPQGEVESKG